ncbi:glycosyltransferase family 2 protein [Thauera sp. SDU_THAU2]|uniref:glycosyltransferase family 2 protein n=1 Tax=Thauera sp. SDU_THAU2 TaxID=3136633 RepID=UPI00311FBC9A
MLALLRTSRRMLRHPWETIGKKAWGRKQFCKRMRGRGRAARPQSPLPDPVRRRCAEIPGHVPFPAVRQSTGLENVEIIVVDDGAGDQVGGHRPAAAAPLSQGHHLYPPGGPGLSAARNTGLAHATGDWVSFGDPDDFLDPNLFARIDAEISGTQGQAPVMIATRPVSYQQDADRFRTDHPLDYRFADTRTELPAADPGNHIQPQVSSAWLDRAAIERHGLRFDPRIGPAFEDAHFVNRLLLREPERNVVFLRDANTYYRTRPNAGVSAEWYIDQFRHGYLDLLEQAWRRAAWSRGSSSARSSTAPSDISSISSTAPNRPALRGGPEGGDLPAPEQDLLRHR